MIVGFSLGIGLTTVSIVFAQNTSTSTNTTTSSTVFAAINTDFITAIAGLIIAVATAAGAFAKLFHVENKVGTALTVVADTAKATLDNRILIKEGLQTTYEMLPEQAQKIVNRPLVRESELTKRINEYEPKVIKAREIADKWGKVVDARLKPPRAGG